MHTVSTTNERNINVNAYCVNNQCALNQQPMRIASDSLMPGFSSRKTFTLSSMPPTPIILRVADGEIAESILPRKYPFPRCVEGQSSKTHLPLERSNSSPQRALSIGRLRMLAVGHGEDTIRNLLKKTRKNVNPKNL